MQDNKNHDLLNTILNKITSLHSDTDGKIDQLEKHVEEKFNDIMLLLNGNGNPERGLVFQVAILKKNESSRNWVMKTIVAAAIGVIIIAVGSRISFNSSPDQETNTKTTKTK